MTNYKYEYDRGNKGHIGLDHTKEICNDYAAAPDTIEEFKEAAKAFMTADPMNEGKIEVSELRYAMCRLGDPIPEEDLDDLLGELDKGKTGFVDIEEWAEIAFKEMLAKEK